MLYPFTEEVLQAAREAAKLGSEYYDDEQGSHMARYLEVIEVLKANGLRLEYTFAWDYNYDDTDISHNSQGQVLCNGHVIGTVITDSDFGIMYLVPKQYVPAY